MRSREGSFKKGAQKTVLGSTPGNIDDEPRDPYDSKGSPLGASKRDPAIYGDGDNRAN